MRASTEGRLGERAAPEPLLERDRELERLSELVADALAGRGGLAMVEGPPGIGKSRLLDAAVRDAESREMTSLRARGGELERDLGWRAVRELFEPALREASAEEREELLSGAAGLARSALGEPQEEPIAGDVAGSSLHGLYWLTSNLAERRPLVVAVDDAQWVDPPSLRFLLYLAQRAEDLPLLLLVAARGGEPGAGSVPLRSLAAQGDVIKPRELSRAASGALTTHLLGSEPDAEFVRVSHELTGGNPFLLRELHRELARDEVRPSAENAERIREVRPEAIRSAVLVRLAQLPDAARRTAEAVSVLGDPVPLRTAATLAELGDREAAEAVESLMRAEILAGELPLEFVHPIIRSVVYEGISSAHRDRMHLRAFEQTAAAEADPEAVAHHLLATAPRSEPKIARALELAAGAAFSRGAPDAAAAYLRRALDEPPAEERRGQVLAMLGQAEAATGDDRAPSRVAAALDLVADPVERAELQLRLGLILYASARPREAEAAFRRGRDELGEDSTHPIGAALTTSYLSLATLTGSVTSAMLEELLDRIPEPPPGRVGPAEREVLVQRALAHVHIPRDYERAGDLALRAVAGGDMLSEQGVTLSYSVAASCLLWADAIAPAEEVADLALQHARRAGDPITAAYALFGRAQPRYWRGALAEAAADAEAAVEAWRGGWGMSLPHVGFWLAMALLDLDRADEAAAALEVSAPREHEVGVHDAVWRMGLARLALLRGDLSTTREELRTVEDLAMRETFYSKPGLWPWRGDAAIAAALDGDDGEAARLMDDDLRLTRKFGAPRPIGSALRAAGLVAGGAEGAELLRESVAVLEDSPARLELCRSLVDLGAALRRAGVRREAQVVLRRGLDLAHRLGALAIERRAREELKRTGARPRREMLSGPESLTPSERRVAELAAEGSTNREIAELLFVSLRTVETHLTHAYGKLEISSRGELPGALELS